MIEDTITQIENRLRRAEAMPGERREELLRLLATLRQEVGRLEHTDGDAAQSIASYAALSTHEVSRATPNPRLVRHALDGLAASVDSFEGSHPRLVQVVNSICTTLANLGI